VERQTQIPCLCVFAVFFQANKQSHLKRHIAIKADNFDGNMLTCKYIRSCPDFSSFVLRSFYSKSVYKGMLDTASGEKRTTFFADYFRIAKGLLLGHGGC